MSSEIERKLDAITEMLDDGWEVLTHDDIRKLLERELKPLLEAGAKMREGYAPWDMCGVSNCEICITAKSWDATLAPKGDSHDDAK
jgi:hypothetical protein